MVFNSLTFLWFFPLVFLLYKIIPLKFRWIMLLIFSYIFYLSWQADLIYLIMFTTVVSYICARKIETAFTKRQKKFYLLIALIASLGVLFFFKYFNFISENVTGLLNAIGLGVGDFTLNLILPVGISFYTFQTLSYVIDVYRGEIKAEKHFGYYALYVSFFPQLVAGPIERPENLLPQFKTKNPFTAYDAAAGLKMMAVGFFKKIAVADQISKYVDAVYNNPDTINGNLVNGFTVALATVLFAVQIYCDFSGYTDIAIGCARVMGIKLMQNFNNPYTATNIKDFWRRWHISLTSWFTDYVYIPLGGSRCSKAKYYRNIFVVFLISGIWHGAAWTYILWGVIHGIYQIVGNLTKDYRSRFWQKMKVNENGIVMQWARRVGTFVLVCIAWMMFRANSLTDFWTLFKMLFTGWSGFSLTASLAALELPLMTIVTIIFSVYILNQLDKQITMKLEDLHKDRGITLERAGAYVYLCWAIAAAWLILLASNAASSFIYFQF
ncbi:MAG: MBOAT family protein [Ruminococcaceae bacterium]|nr:MBOAT family protein [Oscillospiraceae bacterium]